MASFGTDCELQRFSKEANIRIGLIILVMRIGTRNRLYWS